MISYTFEIKKPRKKRGQEMPVGRARFEPVIICFRKGLADATIALLNHQRIGPDHENY